ncbi:DNA polymerase III subunit alpha [candidate division KSB1 bacterium]|nr:DNA polymerase III subunit alpha [candidate division KSB1 bacterium]
MAEFVHLHNHTHYSLLDGACKIPDIIKQCVEYKMPALAITDHGNMFGAIEFYQEASSAGIKPIIGAEVYIAPGSRFEKTVSKNDTKDTSFHLVLLAKDEIGYKNLMKLISIGYLEGFYYKPRIDKEVLSQHSKGLIALSSCLKGEIPQMILRENMERAKTSAGEFKDIFGEDYYLELHDHNIPEERTAFEGLLEVSKSLDIPLVATNDTHYLKKEHSIAHDILICLQTGKDFEDQNRMRFSTDEVYFKSPEEMARLFKDHPQAIKNTLAIAEKCNLKMEFNKVHLPKFEVPEAEGNISLNEYLHKLAVYALPKKYPVVTPKLKERLLFELKIIEQMEYAGYFLIVKDFIDYARSQGIPVGPGRGSAAGSMVSYVLGITNIDPTRYNLFFERFLNPERVSMPDIDIDFCYERREEIINYVRRKYGENNVTQIITFGTMAARAVIRDVGRVLKFSYGEVDKIAKMIPPTIGMTIDKAMELVPELREIARKDELHKKLIENSRILEGLARHSSTHAAGVIITPEELTKYTPLSKSTQGDITTQYDGVASESIGLLKMDFLGLRTLTVIQNTLNMLKDKSIEINLDQIPLDDKDTFSIFAKGETIGIFQFESSGMREYLKKLKPQQIEDLIAMNALYRPGPMDMIDDFIQRKHGLKKIEYPHPVLEPILKETYGVIVYQEQVMQIASELAGFSLGKADLLRRAMGKKKAALMKEQRKLFNEGAAKKNISKQVSDKIFDYMDKFAGYGFNKSHAASYSVVAYQTAYLKAHYPVEFMAANLTSEMGNTKRVVILIEECKRMGIKILPPDVNESYIEFVPNGEGIRFGLGAVKNVGKNAIKSIIRAREENGRFNTIFEFCQNIDLRLVNKKVIESLIQAGALDSLEGYRAQLLESIDLAVNYSQNMNAHLANGQRSIFDLGDEQNVEFELPKLQETEEWNQTEALSREKEMLGFYISGHPLSRYEYEVKLFSSTDLASIHTHKDGTNVRVGAVITNVKKHYDRKNNAMAFVTLEDFSGTAEGLIFSDPYSKFRDLIEPDEMLLFIGRVSIKDEEDEAKILINEVLPLPETWEKCSKNLCLLFNTDQVEEATIQHVNNLLMKHKGNCPVFLNVVTPGNGEYLLRSRTRKARPNSELIRRLRNSLGEKNVWIEPGIQ